VQLANPVIPHITEELWAALGYAGQRPFIQDAVVPDAASLLGPLVPDAAAASRVGQLQEFISQARALKAKYNLASKRDVTVFHAASGEAAEILADNEGLVRTLAGIGELNTIGDRPVDGLPAAVSPLGTLYLDLSSSIDIAAERARLTKELAKLEKQVAAGEGKLKNPKFVESAPAHVVEGARQQLAETTAKRDETKRILDSLVEG